MSSSFEQGSTDLLAFAGIEVNPRQFGRLAQSIAPDLSKALKTITIPEKPQDEETPNLSKLCYRRHSSGKMKGVSHWQLKN